LKKVKCFDVRINGLERYTEAFKNISEAVELIKNEKKSEEDKEERKNLDMRKKLNIDPSKKKRRSLLFSPKYYLRYAL
jgi:DNA gyrase/topoisomerase IV subunit A